MGSLFLSPAPLRDPLNPDRPPDTVLSTYGDLPPPASSPSTPRPTPPYAGRLKSIIGPFDDDETPDQASPDARLAPAQPGDPLIPPQETVLSSYGNLKLPSVSEEPAPEPMAPRPAPAAKPPFAGRLASIIGPFDDEDETPPRSEMPAPSTGNLLGNSVGRRFIPVSERRDVPYPPSPRPERTQQPVLPTLGDPGLTFLTGVESRRYNIYKDSAGNDTIGYGHKLLPGEAERFSSGIDEQTARRLLADDLRVAEKAVHRYVKVPLSQHEYDALVSFTYNVGAGGLAGSRVLRELNAGNRAAAADAMLLWKYAGGVPNDGLLKRRNRERLLFLEGKYD